MIVDISGLGLMIKEGRLLEGTSRLDSIRMNIIIKLIHLIRIAVIVEGIDRGGSSHRGVVMAGNRRAGHLLV